MQVFIKMFNMYNNVDISIDTVAKTFLCNGKNVDIDTIAFVSRLQHITGSWQPTLIDMSIQDGVSYSVTYKTQKNTIMYVGQNRFPENYSQFEKLLSEVM